MITLLTDFGTSDYFVAAVKGVILTINPQVRIADITHEVAPQDIASAAFTLGACYHDFPLGTIHVAVVDPGVGSERRPIVFEAGDYLFVGPDNGIFSYVYTRERSVRVFQITRGECFRQPTSATFHGRDIFAPTAAWLSRGNTPESIGKEILDYVKFELPRPKIYRELGVIEGSIIHIDRFGNCITNFTEQEISLLQPPVRINIKGRNVRQFGAHFTLSVKRDELFAYPGSAGYWEIAIWSDSAARLVGAQVGDKVIVYFK